MPRFRHFRLVWPDFPSGPAPGFVAFAVAPVALVAVGAARPAAALPGIHPVAVSSWDPRASSVVLTGLDGIMSDGHFRSFSYSANFSSTTGILSAQFGAHYVNYATGGHALHGIAGTGSAVFVWPVLPRYANGVPRVGMGWFLGVAPTALVSGEVNYLTVPLVTGLALPLSPSEALTLTPWGEVAPSLNLDSHFTPVTLGPEDYLTHIDPETNEVVLDADTTERLFAESVDLDFSTRLSVRGGIALSLHLGERVSFNVKSAMATVGEWDERQRVLFIGGGLTFRWDAIVPAVLPPERRLAAEDCEDIAERHRACSFQWHEAPATPTAPPLTSSPPSPVPNGQPPPWPRPPSTTIPPAPPRPTAPTPSAPPPTAPPQAPTPPSPTPPAPTSTSPAATVPTGRFPD